MNNRARSVLNGAIEWIRGDLEAIRRSLVDDPVADVGEIAEARESIARALNSIERILHKPPLRKYDGFSARGGVPVASARELPGGRIEVVFQRLPEKFVILVPAPKPYSPGTPAQARGTNPIKGDRR